MTVRAPLDLTRLVEDGRLPPMPHAAGRVLELIGGSDTTADDLRDVIACDPALTAAVLRLVNSALFGLARPVTTLSHAVMLVGFIKLRSLTLTTVTSGLKHAVAEEAAAARDEIWERSVTTALAARALAEQLGLAWSEEAFIAGLLHDAGRFVLLAEAPRAYRDLVAELGRLPLPAEEQEAFGVCHQTVGARLLASWRLAPQLVAVAADHHVERPAEGAHAALTALVMAGARLLDRHPQEPVEGALVHLGFDPAQREELARTVRDEIDRSRTALLSM